MGEQTPQRLKAFREDNASKQSSAKTAVVSLGVGVVLGITGALAAFYVIGPSSNSDSSGMSANRMRELAVLYESKGMPAAAIESYTAYLDHAPLSDTQRGDVAYSIGKLAIANGDYDQALKFLYRAELLTPDSAVRDERDQQILRCLEQLGRTSDLSRELKRRTDASGGETADPGAIVLAEFGSETITDRDLAKKIGEMPQQMRGSFAATEKKIELLRNLVAEHLLLDKAFGLNLDEDEEVIAMMNATRDSLLVQKLMEDEVRASIAITPQDVERYYKAERERFTEPASARVLVANADTEAEAAALTEFNGKPIVVRKGEQLGGLPNSPEVVAQILDAEIDVVTPPIAINDRYFVFKVVSKAPERVVPFEEVKTRTEQSLRQEKEQEHVQLLIEEAMRARNVKLYPERLEAEPAS
jgi:tetratricopeptide (TPR) repeat protein